MGYLAGYANTTGQGITAIGSKVLTSNTTANANVGVGGEWAGNLGAALAACTTGGANTAVGAGALNANTTGTNNTALGYTAGASITTGYNGVYVGNGAGASSVSANNEIVIGTNSPTGKGSGTGFISPNSGAVYQGNNSSTWSTTSDQRLKKNIVDNNVGLDKITQIQVRNFEYRLPEEVDAELKPSDAVKKEGVQLGVIAQELAQVLPECVKQESTGVFRVDTDNLTWYLINAVKELNAEVQSLKQQLTGK